MNNKIQEIINLSSFIMVDPEFTRFKSYLKTKDFNSARIFLDKLNEKLHLELNTSEEFPYPLATFLKRRVASRDK
jgi:hypothetical protein